MPRLVGKSSNTAAYTTLSIVLVAAAVFTALEYVGIVDVVPGFGAGSKVLVQPNDSDRPSVPSTR